mmetsp:Transcript_61608/g.198405  ORF Transcript_61608/g.198405 Transcript_61608/m.198405 type:complete len:218 (+) Transcript_61608:293-946(+)
MASSRGSGGRSRTRRRRPAAAAGAAPPLAPTGTGSGPGSSSRSRRRATGSGQLPKRGLPGACGAASGSTRAARRRSPSARTRLLGSSGRRRSAAAAARPTGTASLPQASCAATTSGTPSGASTRWSEGSWGCQLWQHHLGVAGAALARQRGQRSGPPQLSLHGHLCTCHPGCRVRPLLPMHKLQDSILDPDSPVFGLALPSASLVLCLIGCWNFLRG